MSNGKGSSPRPRSVSHDEYARNWDAVFGKEPKAELALRFPVREQILAWGRQHPDCRTCRVSPGVFGALLGELEQCSQMIGKFDHQPIRVVHLMGGPNVEVDFRVKGDAIEEVL